jgi:hypothetical protein
MGSPDFLSAFLLALTVHLSCSVLVTTATVRGSECWVSMYSDAAAGVSAPASLYAYDGLVGLNAKSTAFTSSAVQGPRFGGTRHTFFRAPVKDFKDAAGFWTFLAQHIWSIVCPPKAFTVFCECSGSPSFGSSGFKKFVVEPWTSGRLMPCKTEPMIYKLSGPLTWTSATAFEVGVDNLQSHHLAVRDFEGTSMMESIAKPSVFVLATENESPLSFGDDDMLNVFAEIADTFAPAPGGTASPAVVADLPDRPVSPAVHLMTGHKYVMEALPSDMSAAKADVFGVPVEPILSRLAWPIHYAHRGVSMSTLTAIQLRRLRSYANVVAHVLACVAANFKCDLLLPNVWTVGAFVSGSPVALPTGSHADLTSAQIAAAGPDCWTVVGTSVLLPSSRVLPSRSDSVTELGSACDPAFPDVFMPVFGLNVDHEHVKGALDTGTAAGFVAFLIHCASEHVATITGIPSAKIAAVSFLTMCHNPLMLGADDSETILDIIRSAAPVPVAVPPPAPAAAPVGPVAPPMAPAPTPPPVAAPAPDPLIHGDITCDDCHLSFTHSDDFVDHVVQHTKCIFCDFTALPSIVVEHIGKKHSGPVAPAAPIAAGAPPAPPAPHLGHVLENAGRPYSALKKAWDLIADHEFPPVADVPAPVSDKKLQSIISDMKSNRFAKPMPGTAKRGGTLFRDPNLKKPLLMRELQHAAMYGISSDQIYEHLSAMGLFYVRIKGAKRARTNSDDDLYDV